MKNENRAVRQFIEWSGGTQDKAAALLGVTRQHVSQILRGVLRVNPELAAKAEQISQGRFRREDFVWPDRMPKEDA